MNIAYKKLLNFLAISIVSIVAAHAGGVTVLEGFEDGLTVNNEGVTNIAPFTLYGEPRTGLPVSVSIYTATDPSDPRVSQGSNSAKIVFPTDGFGNDIAFALSDAAATILESAVSSNQIARYVLRYDLIFEHWDELGFFNQHFFIGQDWEYVRSGGAVVSTYTNGIVYGRVSFSVPVELPALQLPHNPPSTNNAGDFAAAGIPGLTAFIADDFLNTNFTGGALVNYTIYIDNVRLVDTYATPTTVPVIYPLQSFENPTNLLGGAVDEQPSVATLTSYVTNGEYQAATDGGLPDQYTAANPLPLESDFGVTDGSNALEVMIVAHGNYSYGDFKFIFDNTKLGQVISAHLSPAQLANYTLRYDVTTPMVPTNGADGDYINIDYNSVNGAAFPMSTGRRQNTGVQLGLQRETYSLTLDQVAYFPSPDINVSFSQPATWDGSAYFFDNFILINTAPPSTSPSISAESYDPATQQFTLTFASDPGGTYTVEFTSALGSSFSTLQGGIPSGGTQTTTTVTVPGGSAGFIRIIAQ